MFFSNKWPKFGSFEVLRCKFGVSLMNVSLHFMGFMGVSLHQTYIKLTFMRCKFDVNLRP